MAVDDRMHGPGEFNRQSKAHVAGRFAVVALLLAANAFADTTTPAPSANPTHAIILTAKQARACWSDRRKYRTPAASDVQRLESSLARALAELAANDKDSRAAEVLARMTEDVRFYSATTDGFIHVDGFCRGIVEHHASSCPPALEDGGSCSWSIRFHIKHATFDGFQTGGES